MPIKNSDIMQSMEDIYNAVNPKLYTQEELDKAVEAKKEECAKICEELDIDYDCGVSENYQCAEAIRGK